MKQQCYGANLKTRLIEADDGTTLTYEEFMDLWWQTAPSPIRDITMKLQRLIEYDGNWDELDQFYADNP